ncbi:S-adenosyl-L-methionine-dependent methyltransferase [Wilcoxina mikolae CBS 423.85]|nr:S-adenosyl-L-methionine-dependent methyltransferase [Wilcoxina mikolae CBS 423.85]
MSHETSSAIEVDPKVLESESTDYESSGYETSTASLTSSVNEYIIENGRRYHAYFGADKNPLPTDEIEQDRLDMHHEIFLQILKGKLHTAPLKDPQRVLDIGTGTGIWAIDFADAYPMAEVIGTDLSPIQPAWVPPNCRFEVDDAEKEFTYQPNSFDFIHMRNINQGISNWPKLMSQVFRCTKPGGYVELQELAASAHSDDDTMAEDNGVNVFLQHIREAMTKMGRPPATTEAMVKLLEGAGFVDVKVHPYKQPLGPWPKDKQLKRIGAMVMLNCETGFHAYGMLAFTRVLGMDKDEADAICRKGFEAVKNKNSHVYSPFYVVYGKKPEDAE